MKWRLPRFRLRSRPGHLPSWRTEQAILPQIEFVGDQVQCRNIRDFTFHSATDFTPHYQHQSFRLSDVKRGWYIVVPFTRDWRGPAHTFLSFEFTDNQYLALSVEARRAADEPFSLVKGMLRQYDLMYILGTERDLIGLRAVTWDDPVYLYPIRATTAHVRLVLTSMLQRAQHLTVEPEFYHSIVNNCTTNILDAVNQIARPRIPFGPRILLPGYSDALAYRRGLIDTDLSLAEARQRFMVNQQAQAAIHDPAFSMLIREDSSR